MKQLPLILLGVILLLRCQPNAPTTYKLTINDKSITVELADNEQTRAKGLKYRTFLAPDHGMLFSYPDERTLHFWMKDTSIPLSIAFIKSDGVILEILDMEPFSLESISSTSPAQYALETTRGWFKENQVKTSNKVIFPSAIEDYRRKR